jgi:hypothetical protein
MGMSFSHGPPKDKQEMISLIRSAVDRGITFFDIPEVLRLTLGRGARIKDISRKGREGPKGMH